MLFGIIFTPERRLKSEHPEMLYCIEMKFLDMYTFSDLIKGKCLCACKVKASGQDIGLESESASLTSIFIQVLAGLLNLIFNKSYMGLLSKKQKRNYIYIWCFI